MFCLSWTAHATRNTSHDSWPYFHSHVVSFQKSPLQVCRVSRRIWCLLSAPVSRTCWNRRCEVTRGDKHWCGATPSVHKATPLGILSSDIPCSQAQRTHSRTAIGWRSMELVSKLFDTPMYVAIPGNMSKQSFWCQNLGKLTMSETFCPSPLPLAIGQTPHWLQTFLQGLWSQIWVTSSCTQAAFTMASRITAIPPPACLSNFLSCACHNRHICTVL
jgi:hypothetical protein